MLFGLFLGFLYFLPTIIGSSRDVRWAGIFVINLFLGWTLLGWVVALAWAVSAKPKYYGP